MNNPNARAPDTAARIERFVRGVVIPDGKGLRGKSDKRDHLPKSS